MISNNQTASLFETLIKVSSSLSGTKKRGISSKAKERRSILDRTALTSNQVNNTSPSKNATR